MPQGRYKCGLFFTAINGFSFGNLPGIHLCNGDKVRWHVMGHGTVSDIHTLQFEGNHFSYHALHRSAYPLFPGSLATLNMLADNNGKQHFDLGMFSGTPHLQVDLFSGTPHLQVDLF